ncbi:MAG TPA: 6-bladed beta-propeller [Longimicrobiales bacterium]
MLLLAAGCVDQANQRSAVAASSSAGVTEPPGTCRVEKVATSSSEALFSDVVALAVDSNGRIYVADDDNPAITVLSDSGTIIRTIGRDGHGPGEFQHIRNVQVLPGDSLLVFDMGLSRLTVFRPASDSVAYVINLAATARLSPNDVQAAPQRRVFVLVDTEPLRPGDDPASDRERNQVLHVAGWDGSLLRDSILVAPASRPLIARQGGRIGVAAPYAFGRPGIVRVSRSGRIYYGYGDSLRIDIYSLEGQRTGGFVVPYERDPVSDADLEAAIPAYGDFFRKAVQESAPDYWPAFKRFVVDDHGRLWMALIADGQVTDRGAAAMPRIWTVMTEAGELVCRANLEERTEVVRVQDGRLYGVVKDDVDVPRIVIYRIVHL